MSNLSRRSFLRTGLAGGATLAVSTVSTAALAAKPAKGLYIPGTYSAKAAGIGDIVVTMTFDENRITDVVLNVAHETPSIVRRLPNDSRLRSWRPNPLRLMSFRALPSRRMPS